MMDHRCGECPACLSDMAELVPCQRAARGVIQLPQIEEVPDYDERVELDDDPALH